MTTEKFQNYFCSKCKLIRELTTLCKLLLVAKKKSPPSTRPILDFILPWRRSIFQQGPNERSNHTQKKLTILSNCRPIYFRNQEMSVDIGFQCPILKVAKSQKFFFSFLSYLHKMNGKLSLLDIRTIFLAFYKYT